MYVRTQQSSVTVRFFSNFYLLMQDDDGGTKNVFIATTAKFIVFFWISYNANTMLYYLLI